MLELSFKHPDPELGIKKPRTIDIRCCVHDMPLVITPLIEAGWILVACRYYSP